MVLYCTAEPELLFPFRRAEWLYVWLCATSNLHLDTKAAFIHSFLPVKTKKGQINCRNPNICFNTAFYPDLTLEKSFMPFHFILFCPRLGNVFPDSLFTLGERSRLSEVTHIVCLPQDQRKKKRRKRRRKWKTHDANLDNKMAKLLKRDFFGACNKFKVCLKQPCYRYLYI